MKETIELLKQMKLEYGDIPISHAIRLLLLGEYVDEDAKEE